jgi:hypothetical protein
MAKHALRHIKLLKEKARLVGALVEDAFLRSLMRFLREMRWLLESLSSATLKLIGLRSKSRKNASQSSRSTSLRHASCGSSSRT